VAKFYTETLFYFSYIGKIKVAEPFVITYCFLGTINSRIKNDNANMSNKMFCVKQNRRKFKVSDSNYNKDRVIAVPKVKLISDTDG